MLDKLHLDLYQWSTLNQVMLMKGLTASRDILLEDLRRLSMGIGHANDWTEIQSRAGIGPRLVQRYARFRPKR